MPFFLLAAACTKDRTTVLSGQVISNSNGKPLPNASLGFVAYNGYEHDSSVRKVMDTRSYSTGADGTFHIIFESSVKYDGVGVTINAGSHYPASRVADAGETKDFGTIGLDIIIAPPPPLGVLRITAKNTADTLRKIWYKTEWYGVSLENNSWYFDFPLNLNPGFPITKTYRVEANRQVPVYWDFHAFSGGNSAHRDSIYCAEKDTVDYEIDF